MDNVSITLILLNTVYMALEAQFRMQTIVAAQPIPRWLWWGNVFVASAFSVELVVKAAILRSDFCRKNWGWNLFDVFLVVCTVCDVVFEGLGVSFFRCLRIIRAVRASRCLQAIQYV